MKKNILLGFIFLTLMMPFRLSHANSSVVDSTVVPFCTALQSGDLNVIKPYVGGDMYQKMMGAFEQNKNYGAFLKQRYDGAIFHPTVIEQSENEMLVSVEVEFQEKGISVFELLVQKNKTGTWQIMNQQTSTRRNFIRPVKSSQ